VLLGLFILCQLGFLFLANALGFVTSIPKYAPDKPARLINRLAPPGSDDKRPGFQGIENNLRWWTQLSGQDQEWALFAPDVGKLSAFPCVLLLWDETLADQPGVNGVLLSFDAKNGFDLRLDAFAPHVHLLLSDNEPPDVNGYFRIGNCRLRRYEGQLHVPAQPQARDTPAQTAARMNERVQYLRDQYHDLALAYVRWRVDTWRLDHAEKSVPKQVILGERSYCIHDPDEPRGWDGPQLIPLLRWFPWEKVDTLPPPPEMFDFNQQRFVR
jgi:hypothetical protein